MPGQPGINIILTGCYIGIQVAIALLVSIRGVIHVRQCMSAETKTSSIQIQNPNQAVEIEMEEAGRSETTNKAPNSKKQKGFFKLWVKTVWRMRNVYSGLAVHSFDVLTDVLVILQWLQATDIDGDHVDPQVMAYSAIGVILLAKVVSAIAIYLKERDIIRAILQLFDLLIFQEIFESHRKIISQMENKTVGNRVESTLSFKYVRSMEAIFESIPQAVLQLVYVMRTGTKIEDLEIFVISIIQSMISMTNSILNNDYTRMQEDKWKKFKQRFPPTIHFLRHALCRLCEVTYRIGLLALFWTVCGGMPFSIMMGIDLLFTCFRLLLLIKAGDNEHHFDGDTILSNINSLIVIPSEDVYNDKNEWHMYWFSDVCGDCGLLPIVCIMNCCCCMWIASFLAACSKIIKERRCDVEIYTVPTMRIGVSIMTFIFLITWAFIGENGERHDFLFRFKHGLSVFIVTCVSFMIYTQYMILFPDFSLPFGVSVRSKWGYAFADELSELKKVKVPYKKMPYTKKMGWNREDYEITDAAGFWDEPFAINTRRNDNSHDDESVQITAAVCALAKENYQIVRWLENQGAVSHKDIDVATAKHAMLEGSRSDL
eukprot:370511_1